MYKFVALLLVFVLTTTVLALPPGGPPPPPPPLPYWNDLSVTPSHHESVIEDEEELLIFDLLTFWGFINVEYNYPTRMHLTVTGASNNISYTETSTVVLTQVNQQMHWIGLVTPSVTASDDSEIADLPHDAQGYNWDIHVECNIGGQWEELTLLHAGGYCPHP